MYTSDPRDLAMLHEENNITPKNIHSDLVTSALITRVRVTPPRRNTSCLLIILNYSRTTMIHAEAYLDLLGWRQLRMKCVHINRLTAPHPTPGENRIM
jgi:hypothetical protein